MCILHNAVPVRLVHPAKSTKKRPACRRPPFAGNLMLLAPVQTQQKPQLGSHSVLAAQAVGTGRPDNTG